MRYSQGLIVACKAWFAEKLKGEEDSVEFSPIARKIWIEEPKRYLSAEAYEEYMYELRECCKYKGCD